ncbi:hypothetical protein TNIN_322521 [Trichonephila inaurata madagascariensis]|uniref:Uncharacterized protein n=1 Tax=Trichonephila inaurata madagascariensis TaxID=2747483 RepID=A0A8X7C6J6_9ARAC|nr:hypothetical protein TNIN_322521 [Trichonephila inaurata madagascariensis]
MVKPRPNFSQNFHEINRCADDSKEVVVFSPSSKIKRFEYSEKESRIIEIKVRLIESLEVFTSRLYQDFLAVLLTEVAAKRQQTIVPSVGR